MPRVWGRPFAVVIVPPGEDGKNIIGGLGIDESLADLIAHGVQVGVRDSEFAEGGPYVIGIVDLPHLSHLEFDGLELFCNRWCMNRPSFQ